MLAARVVSKTFKGKYQAQLITTYFSSLRNGSQSAVLASAPLQHMLPAAVSGDRETYSL